MDGFWLSFFVSERERIGGRLAYEWLLEQARALGIGGGSALRGIAGYGRHGALHEQHFFELAGDLPVTIEFALREDQIQPLLDRIAAQKVSFFYVKTAATFGSVGGP
jgi:PII-like signaling protein